MKRAVLVGLGAISIVPASCGSPRADEPGMRAYEVSGDAGTSCGANPAPPNPSDPYYVGQMAAAQPWPEVAIHAALTSRGKVLTFQGDFNQPGQQFLWDPLHPTTSTTAPNTAVDLFCAGQPVLADGRVLVIGGTSNSGGLGVTATTAFDPNLEQWETWPAMHFARWYGTGTTLGNGRILVSSGADQEFDVLSTTPEVLDPVAKVWTSLPSADNPLMPLYPHVFQLPDGRVLWAGASEQATRTMVLDAGLQRWTDVDARLIDGAATVNYEVNKFMKSGSATDSGGTGDSASTAFTLDMSQPTPAWTPTGSMSFPRSFENLTALPDGTVLVTGGDRTRSSGNEATGVLPSEIWNPSTGAWTTVASLGEPRMYHSTAILLPDGRVWLGGGGGDPPFTTFDHETFQLYSPPYLFRGPRPAISSVSPTVTYGSTIVVASPDATCVARVSLHRTGSTTHAFDQNGRAMSLAFSQTSGGLRVTMPPNGNTAPPGYYMLFLVSAAGVPSVGSLIRFPAPWEQIAVPAPASTPPWIFFLGLALLGAGVILVGRRPSVS